VRPIEGTYPFADQQIKQEFKLNAGRLRYPPVGDKYIQLTAVDVYG
jgi:hypothetical protein